MISQNHRACVTAVLSATLFTAMTFAANAQVDTQCDDVPPAILAVDNISESSWDVYVDNAFACTAGAHQQCSVCLVSEGHHALLGRRADGTSVTGSVNIPLNGTFTWTLR
ncbi:MAG: hypothetical protein HY243_19340 [Proteobacteria bacterium]|nr:hypothetical protein [Pseudomonadota bacterium]